MVDAERASAMLTEARGELAAATRLQKQLDNRRRRLRRLVGDVYQLDPGLRPADIAHYLDVPDSTVRSWLRDAVAARRAGSRRLHHDAR
ncbi:MAG: hypothetical protein ACRCZP_11610 [Phycicoccus sp.]